MGSSPTVILHQGHETMPKLVVRASLRTIHPTSLTKLYPFPPSSHIMFLCTAHIMFSCTECSAKHFTHHVLMHLMLCKASACCVPFPPSSHTSCSYAHHDPQCKAQGHKKARDSMCRLRISVINKLTHIMFSCTSRSAKAQTDEKARDSLFFLPGLMRG